MPEVAQQLKRIFADPVENIVLQLPRALAASAAAALVDFGVLCFLVEWAGWNPATAAVAGYLTGGVLQYILCSLWVFPNAPANAAAGFVAFTVLSLVGLGITWTVILGLYDFAHIHYTFAKVIALGLTFFWNFLSRKYLLFRRSSEALQTSEA
ncbi:MAG: GtrA family protein [Gemmataceae bacterium]|nr:GtrA family protein [Gemmataceae bacterium]MCI0740388.1 GtrA family protein [Gemmataceae bacterium]